MKIEEELSQKYKHENGSNLSAETIQILKSTIPLPNSENFPNMELKLSSSSFPLHSSIVSVRCPALLSVNSPLDFDKKIGQLLVKYVYHSFTVDGIQSEGLSILEVFELMRMFEVVELPHLTYLCQVNFIDMISKGNIALI